MAFETIFGDYVKGNKIIPRSEEEDRIKNRTISVVTFSQKTKKMAQVAKETFEESLKSLALPVLMYTRRSFATWDLVMKSKEDAEKV